MALEARSAAVALAGADRLKCLKQVPARRKYFAKRIFPSPDASMTRLLAQRSRNPAVLALGALVAFSSGFAGTRITPLIADRTALERVYYTHRLGIKPDFEKAMPSALLEKLVRTDARKETVLGRVYGVMISPAMVEAEVVRIDSTTRAPEMLAEIKAALGGDPARFARTLARPLLVERLLHARFDNDDSLHAAQRCLADAARRAALLAQPAGPAAQLAAWRAGKAGVFAETTWQLTAGTAGTKPEPGPPLAPPPAIDHTASGNYSVQATARILQLPAAPASEKASFEDLAPEWKNVLRAQLQKPGDVSAVIEMSTGFVIFFVREKTAEALSVCSLSIGKRSYEDWLAEQPDADPP